MNKPRTSHGTQRRSRSFRPTLESLETRQLMAGDVSLSLSGGNLLVQGDALSNQIEIRQLRNGDFRIESEDNGATVIHGMGRGGGGLSYDVSPDDFNDMIVELGGGDDYVYVRNGVFPRDLKLDFGSGRDAFDIANATTRDDLWIDLGDDGSNLGGREYGSIVNTRVGSSAYYNNDLQVTGNAADQVLYLYGLDVEDDLDLILANDDYQEDEVHLNDVTVRGEAGDARLRIFATTVQGGDVTNTQNSAGDLYLQHAGDVDLDGVRVGDDIWVHGRKSASLEDTIRIAADQAGDVIRLRGHAGNDTLTFVGSLDAQLYGGEGADWLHGGSGDDVLYGGAGDDVLFGNAGVDTLFGEGDNDFLDAGSATESVNGGAGRDFNAYQWAIYGAEFDDVYQGGSPTCWVVSAISAVARTGNVDLADRINYLGSGQYQVSLYQFENPNARGSSDFYQIDEIVEFTGHRNSVDAKFNPNHIEGEFWVVLVQRALLQAIEDWDPTQSVTDPHTGGAGDPMAMLTGQNSTNNSPSNWYAFSHMTSALASGQSVIGDTRDSTSDLTTDLLVANHQYVVMSVTYSGGEWKVNLRNPHGTDSGTSLYGADDGYVTISYTDFVGSMNSYIVN